MIHTNSQNYGYCVTSKIVRKIESAVFTIRDTINKYHELIENTKYYKKCSKKAFNHFKQQKNDYDDKLVL